MKSILHIVLISLITLSLSCSTPTIYFSNQGFSKMPDYKRKSVLIEFCERFSLPSEKYYTTPRYRRMIENLQLIALRDGNALVRSHAIDTLALVAGKRAEATYIRGLKDKEFIVRYQSIKALQVYGTAKSLPELMKSLRSDPDPHCRREAAKAIAKIDDQSIIKDLINILLREEREGVQYSIHTALVKLTREPREFNIDLWEEWLNKRPTSSKSE